MFTGVNDMSFELVRKMVQDAVKSLFWQFRAVFDVVYFESDYRLVPDSGKKIHAAFNEAFNGGQKMPILATPEDCRCFLGVYGNNLYRAIHDWDHYQAYTEGFGTTKLQDEAALNLKMVSRILANIDAIDAGLRRAIEVCLLADLVGQAYYFAQRKTFVGNEKQLDFVVWLVGHLDWLGIDANGPHYDKWEKIVFPDFS